MNTQSTDGTTQHKGNQPSCCDDQKVKKVRFRSIYTHYIDTKQGAESETLSVVESNGNSVNRIRIETPTAQRDWTAIHRTTNRNICDCISLQHLLNVLSPIVVNSSIDALDEP